MWLSYCRGSHRTRWQTSPNPSPLKTVTVRLRSNAHWHSLHSCGENVYPGLKPEDSKRELWGKCVCYALRKSTPMCWFVCDCHRVSTSRHASILARLWRCGFAYSLIFFFFYEVDSIEYGMRSQRRQNLGRLLTMNSYGFLFSCGRWSFTAPTPVAGCLPDNGTDYFRRDRDRGEKHKQISLWS